MNWRFSGRPVGKVRFSIGIIYVGVEFDCITWGVFHRMEISPYFRLELGVYRVVLREGLEEGFSVVSARY